MGNQIEQDLSPIIIADSQRNAALTGVEVSEAQAALAMGLAFGKRCLAPCTVAGRRLDLDHVHSQVSQQLATERAHGGTQVEDAISGQERSCCVGARHQKAEENGVLEYWSIGVLGFKSITPLLHHS